MPVPDESDLETEVDEAMSEILAQRLPDIRDQGRSFRFGEYLRVLNETRKGLRISGRKVGVAWLGKE